MIPARQRGSAPRLSDAQRRTLWLIADEGGRMTSRRRMEAREEVRLALGRRFDPFSLNAVGALEARGLVVRFGDMAFGPGWEDRHGLALTRAGEAAIRE